MFRVLVSINYRQSKKRNRLISYLTDHNLDQKGSVEQLPIEHWTQQKVGANGESDT